MPLRHRFVGTNPDGPDPTKVQTSNWNDEHIFTGGALGSLLYRDTGVDGGVSWLADAAAGNVLLSGGVGAAPSYGKVGLATHVSGTLPAANLGGGLQFFTVAGPTSARTFTFPDADASIQTTTGSPAGFVMPSQAAGDFLYASSPSAWSRLPAGTAAQVLKGGTTPSWASVTSGMVDTSIWTGTVATGLLKASSQGVLAQATAGTDYQTPNGSPAGFVIASQAVGDLLFASTTTAWSRLADVAAGSVLASGGVGVAPAWSATPTLTSLTLGALNFSGGQSLVGTTADLTELRHGTTTQAFAQYQTYTDASNYSRYRQYFSGGTMNLLTEKAGTGTVQNMEIQPGTAGTLYLGANSTRLLVMDSSGLYPNSATLDWGKSANPWRSIYAGTSVVVGGATLTAPSTTLVTSASILSGASITAAAASNINWTGRSTLSSLATGTLQITQSDGNTGFTIVTTAAQAWFKAADGTSDTAILKANKVNATGNFQQNGTDGVTAGPFTSITSITVKGGIVTAISGS